MEKEKRAIKKMIIVDIELLSMLIIFGIVTVIMLKKQIMTTGTVNFTSICIVIILLSVLFVFIHAVINYILSRLRR